MKRLKCLATLMTLIFLCACGSINNDKWSDGSYEGVSKGVYGDVVMNVVIVDGKIASIDVVSHSESPGLTDAAFDQIPKAIIEKQGVDDIDTLAGSTITSKAIIEAIREALTKAENRRNK